MCVMIVVSLGKEMDLFTQVMLICDVSLVDRDTVAAIQSDRCDTKSE